MAFTGKLVYVTQHFVLLRLNPFDLSVKRAGWWFELLQTLTKFKSKFKQAQQVQL